MKTQTIHDIYNTNKVWIIKKTKCYHYYLIQSVKGKTIGKIRTTKKHLTQIFNTYHGIEII